MIELFKNNKKYTYLFFLFWIMYFSFFWFRVFFFENGNIYVGNQNMWGDWPAHFDIGSAFAYRSLYMPNHPLFLFHPFSYPFITDMISGILIRVGIGFIPSFAIPSLVFSVFFVFMIYLLYKKMSGSSSLAILASIIFFLNGGTGWFYYLMTLKNNFSFRNLFFPMFHYTNLPEYGIHFANIIDSQILPQRALTLGFPMALTILYFAYSVVFHKTNIRTYQYVFAGLMYGFLFIVHTHSFIAVSIIIVYWVITANIHSSSTQLKEMIKKWALFYIPAIVISTIFYFLFYRGSINSQFIRWFPGWYTHIQPMNIIIFWIKNWGVIPLLAFIGLIKQKNKHIFIPFFLLFVMANLILFQPFEWDNTKIFIWCSVGFSYLSALVIKKLFNQNTAGKILALAILFFSIFSGFLEITSVQQIRTQSKLLYTQEELGLANWVKDNTSKDSYILSGDQHNSWMQNLTGRNYYMAYRGWLKTYGFEYEEILTNIQNYYHGEYGDILRPEYIVIGPYEKSAFHIDSNEFSNDRFVKIFATKNYSIYKTVK